MTRTSSPRASRRSARCEPMKPAPPVISTLMRVTSSRSLESVCGSAAAPVVERLLPELEARAAPELRPKRCSVARPAERPCRCRRARGRARRRDESVSRTKSRTGPGRAATPAAAPGKPILSVRVDDRRRAARRRTPCLQHVLQLAVLELHVGRHRRRELDERVVEERHARLEAVRHAHAVLDLQQRRQQRLEVEVGHRVEVRLLADVVAVEDRAEASRTASSRRAASQSISSPRSGARLISRK